MQIKTTMSYHFTPDNISLIKKYTNNKCCRGVWRKGNFLHCQWECKLVQPLWRRVWRLLKKLKIELQYNPAIPLLGIYSEKTIILKYACTSVFTEALLAIVKTWKYPKCPLIYEWVKKSNGILLSH